MTLLERNQLILSRIQRPDPAAERVREILVRGKREQLLQGVDCHGVPFQSLAPSTVKRSGYRKPLVGEGEGSRLITGYVVTVHGEPGRLAASAGWPGLDFVRYLASGTRKMPRRDPTGFREQDKQMAMDALKEYVFRG